MNESNDGATRGDWTVVDRGWGHAAIDFATLSEPANCREYVALHQHLSVGAGDRLLDVACGAGLAIELARARGSHCAGIDASERLVTIANDRNPDSDIRVGDMHAMPWADGQFDVVTSFRGIWGTTPDALREVHRVLAPGGRLGLTVWGHIKASPGAWSLFPFTLAAAPKVQNQASMVALGRPGAGEQLLATYGFEQVRRVTIPFVWEFSDPQLYARALASTGPAFEAIEQVGEDEFLRIATELAQQQLRDGLPLRASIDVVGYLARTPAHRPARARHHHLAEAPTSPGAEAMFAGDHEEMGFVMNASRLWAYQPSTHDGLFDLLGECTKAGQLTVRQRGILVTATASTLGDSYCSIAWGKKLSEVADSETSASVLTGDDGALTEQEHVLAEWARAVVRNPSGTTSAQIETLRDAGFTDAQIFAITSYIALRVAFSMVNGALGAHPDAQLADSAPEPVMAAVTYGRAPATAE